jgi:hypothetical protein
VTNQSIQAGEAGQVDGSGQVPPTDRSIAEALSGAGAYVRALPAFERHVATLAAKGSSIPEIAAETGQSEAAVARTIDAVLAAVSGRHRDPVETGGLGADTDPGVTGGYGDTGFGALDTDPVAVNDEPDEGDIRPEPA